MKELIYLHAVNTSKLIIGGYFDCVLRSVDRVSGVTDESTCELMVLKI